MRKVLSREGLHLHFVRLVQLARQFPGESLIFLSGLGVGSAIFLTPYNGAMPIQAIPAFLVLITGALAYAVRMDVTGRAEKGKWVRQTTACAIALAFGFILFKNHELPLPLLPAVAATITLISRGRTGLILIVLLGLWLAFLSLTHTVEDSALVMRTLASHFSVVTLVFILNSGWKKEEQAKITIEKYSGELQSALKTLAESNSELSKAASLAESANESKTRFLSNMSHEMRTPLNAILGMLQLARQDQTIDPLREKLSSIEASSKILIALVNDVLDVAKIEADELSLDLRPLNLSKLLDEVRGLACALAVNKPVQLQWEFADDLDRMVLGDDLRIKQILLNLLSNAIKFTEHGTVHMAVRVLGDDTFQFLIKDDGIGMSPSALDTVFKPFVQVDNSMSRQYGGSGLGLTIVQSLIEQMKGRIDLESELGKGTSAMVTLQLPAVTVDGASLSERSVGVAGTAQSNGTPEANDGMDGTAKPLQGLHILVAEDNDMNQMIVESILKNFGAHVSLADNGKEAVELATRLGKAIDLVLMDIQMPVMDGLEATRQMRALPGLENLPIVALSANAIKSEIETCIQSGMQEYLTKPLNTELLVSTIQKLTSG